MQLPLLLLLLLLGLQALLAAAPAGQARIHQAAAELPVLPSICPGLCTQYGTCNEELGRCDCPKGLDGPDCSQPATSSTLDERCEAALYPSVKECLDHPQACMNACNWRGRCLSGFCHCKPGHYGADCSLSLNTDGKPVLLAGTQYATRRKRPHVYVYELPPRLTTWVNVRRLDRPTHHLFAQRLLSSWARTADGDAADWYYIPVRARGHGDGHLLLEAIEYIRTTWPWWNRTHGARHIIMHTGDLGVQEGPLAMRALTANSTWLTHWGLYKDKTCCGWRAAHRIGQDVVIPVYISTGSFAKFGFTKSPLHPRHPGYERQSRRHQQFFFAGRICGDRREPAVGVWPNCQSGHDYSANVRQKVHYHHHNRSGFTVITHSNQYDKQLRSTRFCLAPLGGGHGQRQIIVAAQGCIPVTIGDDVHQPFEPQLNWSAFSVPVLEQDIPVLHEKLQEVVARPGALEAMQHALRCAAQHMIYSTVTGGFLGEQGKYDAFETTLEVLRVMAQHPGADPATFSSLDADFARFMNCGAEGQLGDHVSQEQAANPGASALDASRHSPDSEADKLKAKAQPDAQATEIQRGQSDQGNEKGYRAWLCSNAKSDAPRPGEVATRPSCYDCLLGASGTHGLPGGAICCGSQGDLSKCLRNWD